MPDSIDCLITGGTGLVGNNLIRLLLERGLRVRTLVRGRAGSRAGHRGAAVHVGRGHHKAGGGERMPAGPEEARDGLLQARVRLQHGVPVRQHGAGARVGRRPARAAAARKPRLHARALTRVAARPQPHRVLHRLHAWSAARAGGKGEPRMGSEGEPIPAAKAGRGTLRDTAPFI